MELRKYKDSIYGKKGSQLFYWESTWDSWRPIEKIVWNGSELVPYYKKYTTNLFDSLYGYGTPEMKLECKTLSETVELEHAKEMMLDH